jgi:hypothetical protein
MGLGALMTASVFVVAANSSPTLWAASPAKDIVMGDPPGNVSVAHEIAIRNVGAGEESISISAKLSEKSLSPVADVLWRIFGEDGEKLFEGKAGRVETRAAPGQYLIEAQYGGTALRETLTVFASKRTAVNYILNAGVLRILPRIAELHDPGTHSVSRVYALSGPETGKLVFTSTMPGEVIRLSAGTYRVQSTFAGGNAVSVTDVTVKPAIMSAVDIDHKAGIAKLAYLGDPDKPVTWQVTSETGETLPLANGAKAHIVLKPGRYTAKAQINGEYFTAAFEITAGRASDITVGN